MTTRTHLGTSAFPPIPSNLTGVEYASRVIGSETYQTTGVFPVGSTSHQFPELVWVGEIIADADLVDYWIGDSDDAPKLTKLHGADTKVRKAALYRYAELHPDRVARLREAHLAEIHRALGLAEITPTLIVDSGWGYHVHAWVADGQGYTSDEGPTGALALRTINARLIATINGHLGYELFDRGVHDAGTRILREIGSTNGKAPENPRPVVEVERNPEARLDLSTYTVPRLPPTARRDGAKAAPSATVDRSTPGSSTLTTVPASLPPAVQALIDNTPRLRDLWNGKGKSSGDTSGSGYDMSLGLALAKKGIPATDIAATVMLRRPSKVDLREANRTAQAACALASNQAPDAEAPENRDPDVWGRLARSPSGVVLTNVSNTALVLSDDPQLRDRIAYEERTLTVRVDPATRQLWRGVSPSHNPDRMQEEDAVGLRTWIYATYGFEPGPMVMQDAILLVSRRHRRNDLTAYLDGVTWDGTSRLDTWLSHVTGCADSALTRAYSRKFLIGAVARAFEPGCQMDTCLVLVGPQGRRKSTMFRALAAPEHFADTAFDLGNKDAYLQIHQSWVYEIGEMSAFSKAEVTAIKAFLTSKVDAFRAPYERSVIAHPRSMVFVASSNDPAILRDPTGSRRFWPVTVGDAKFDVEWVLEHRDQLWAEAVEAYRAGKSTGADHLWHLTDEEEALHLNDADNYTEDDPTDAAILRWFATRPEGKVFELDELLTCALGVSRGDFERHRNKIGARLRKLGCSKGKPDRHPTEGRKWTPWTPPPGIGGALSADPAIEEVFGSNVVPFPSTEPRDGACVAPSIVFPEVPVDDLVRYEVLAKMAADGVDVTPELRCIEARYPGLKV